jgi:hypothetical protein
MRRRVAASSTSSRTGPNQPIHTIYFPDEAVICAYAARKLDQSAARKVIHLRAVPSTLF